MVEHHPDRYSGVGGNTIFVVSHGWHTGFVVPSAEIQKHIPELGQRFKGSPYIEFGWGDKGFYQSKEITLGLTLRAIFWPTQSVVHAVAVPDYVESYFGGSKVERLCLNNEALDSLNRFISSSFYRESNRNIVELKQGIYGDSQFYQGVGDYYLMNTCNKWTAKGLESIGMESCPTFKLTASSIMNYLEDERSARTQLNSGSPDNLSCAPEK